MSAENREPILVSACLIGVNCRYDGEAKTCEKAVKLMDGGQIIPVCPEQLGGFPTPRVPAERKGERVITQKGEDVTYQFQKGAEQALKIAKMVGAKKAVLKARSPSCGSGETYDGTFSGKLIPGDGVFAEMCKENGITVITEEELENL